MTDAELIASLRERVEALTRKTGEQGRLLHDGAFEVKRLRSEVEALTRERDEFGEALTATADAGSQQQERAEKAEAELARLRSELERKDEALAALLVETGRVPDPRLDDLRLDPIETVVARGPRTFAALARPLTPDEVKHVLAAALASSPKKEGDNAD